MAEFAIKSEDVVMGGMFQWKIILQFNTGLFETLLKILTIGFGYLMTDSSMKD